MIKFRKDKLAALKNLANTETGILYQEKFTWENTLYEKAVKMKALNAKIARCRKCPGLNLKRFTESCPAWGCLNSKIFVVGQSLHQPGVVSGLPFILGSGYSLDAALYLSGLKRHDIIISNTVHCHPPSNRESAMKEKQNCLPFLRAELEIVQPKLIVALGNDAQWAVNEIKTISPSPKRSSNKLRGASPYLRSSFFQGVKVLNLKHPAAFIYSAPEMRIDWIVKLSLEMDKVLPISKPLEMYSEGEQFAGDKALAQGPTAFANENLPQNVELGKTFVDSCKFVGKKKYKTIYVDPPWPEKGGGKIRRGADKHYELLSLAAIARLKPLLDKLAGKNCHLYLWTTNNYLESALHLLAIWGFKYITVITWQKDRKGLGQYFRGKTEHCLFAKRGNLPYKTKDGKRAQGITGFIEKRKKHSAKPETMRQMIETVSYPPRIELFAREEYKGWDVWGDEV